MKWTLCLSVCLSCGAHQVALVGRVVLLGAHAHQAVVVEEDPERVAGGDQDVDAQVELEALHQEGFLQVLLHDEVVLARKLLAVADQGDPEDKQEKQNISVIKSVCYWSTFQAYGSKGLGTELLRWGPGFYSGPR